ncbi:MAG TPA: PIN domain-containing protein [Thermoanaerobaculia bacterium]|nr:PIN domain-containing protein [Thermoanaerobaculia bacterium]
MSVRTFVDTNVLVYAHDRGSGRRHRIAREVLRELWEERTGVLSTQVLQELYVNVRRRARKPIGAQEARDLIQDYLSWPVVVNDGTALVEAIALERRYRLSFWDALIVQAANAAGAEVLLTEDLNAGQRYGAVEALNPFAG